MSDEPASTESQTALRTGARSTRLRFSLLGIFIFVLGLAVALAYRRIPNVGWFDTILAACASWIGVGLIQGISNTWRLWRQNRHLPRELQWGFVVELSRQLSAALMIAAGATFLLIRQTREDDSNHDYMFDWTLVNLAWTIFYFGIVVAYAPQLSSKPVNRTTSGFKWSTAFEWIAVALGTYWLLHMLASQMAVTGLVHLAIRGVESYQPLRWMNEPFYPANFHTDLTRQFVERSLLASILVAFAVGSMLLLNRCWNILMMRLGWFLSTLASLSGAAMLAWWAWTVAYPVLSPFLAPQTFTQPAINWVAGLTLVTGAAFIFASSSVLKPVAAPDAVERTPNQMTLQFWFPVMILFLLATLGTCLQDRSFGAIFGSLFGGSSRPFGQWLWEYSVALLEGFVGDSRMMMQLAALIVVGRQVWQRWRREPAPPFAPSAVNPMHFLVVSALAAVCLLVAIPVAGWLGFVLVVYPSLLGL